MPPEEITTGSKTLENAREWPSPKEKHGSEVILRFVNLHQAIHDLVCQHPEAAIQTQAVNLTPRRRELPSSRWCDQVPRSAQGEDNGSTRKGGSVTKTENCQERKQTTGCELFIG